MNRDDFIKELKAGVCKVKFTKVDGTIREIEGTLHDGFLPVAEETEAEKKINPEVVALYDINADHWKSFRIDSVISFATEDHFHYWTDAESAVDPYLTLPRDTIETLREGKDYSLHIR